MYWNIQFEKYIARNNRTRFVYLFQREIEHTVNKMSLKNITNLHKCRNNCIRFPWYDCLLLKKTITKKSTLLWIQCTEQSFWNLLLNFLLHCIIICTVITCSGVHILTGRGGHRRWKYICMRWTLIYCMFYLKNQENCSTYIHFI